jgi:hypothetical protein
MILTALSRKMWLNTVVFESVRACVCSLSDIDIDDWLLTFPALLAFRGRLPNKIRRQCPAIFKNKQHHCANSESKRKGKPVLRNEAPKVLLLFLQNTCEKHGFQYLPSQKLRLRRRLQPEHDMRHRSEQISKPQQSQDLHQYSDNCFNLAQLFWYLWLQNYCS